jgi:prepilin-type N-terminal cleavage/methylation domain-containing protein
MMTPVVTGHLRRGFTMLEILMALIIVGLSLTIAGELFESTMRASQSAAESHNAASSLETAVAVLRNDVWGASAIDVAAAQGVTLKLAGGRSVTWTIAPDGILTRMESDVPPRKWTLPPGASLAAEEAELILRLRASKFSAGGEVRMSSQVLLLRRMAS